MNLSTLLDQHAAARPDAPALLDATGRELRAYSFAQLAQAVVQGAAFLHQLGIQPGDRVLVFHPMAADLYVLLGALLKLGAAAVFVDPGLGRDQVAQACATWQPRALFATPKAHLLRITIPALRRVPVKIATGWGVPGAVDWRGFTRAAPGAPGLATDADTPALITTTSGSTGHPKIAVRTQGFLLAQHRAITGALALGPGDRIITTLPIFVLSFLASGATTILPSVDLRRPGQIQGGLMIGQIETHQATCLAASPALLESVAQACLAASHTLPQMTRIYGGGAPVFPDLLDDLHAVAPNAQVTAVYGATEAEPIAHLDQAAMTPADRAAMQTGGGLLVGAPIRDIQVRVLPDRWGEPLTPLTGAEFAALVQPAATAGEIVVAGDHVLPGYWQGEGDAETKLQVDGTLWHRTGDAGYFDTAGRLWLLGRCAARVHDAHGVLYPFAVEAAARVFPEVRHAAFVAQAGARLLALESYRPLTPAREVELAQALAWAAIDEIVTLRHLPVDKRHNAKVDYPALRKELAQRSIRFAAPKAGV